MVDHIIDPVLGIIEIIPKAVINFTVPLTMLNMNHCYRNIAIIIINNTNI